MSQYQANNRIGHLEDLYHTFSYLKSHMEMGRISYDPMVPNVDLSVFNDNADWTGFYGDVEEELPLHGTETRGRAVSIYSFVDANHADIFLTRLSHAGIFMFIRNTPIIWFSKIHNTVEAATFGSELVVISICKYLIVALRYKLWMFGIILEGPAHVFPLQLWILEEHEYYGVST